MQTKAEIFGQVLMVQVLKNLILKQNALRITNTMKKIPPA